MLRALVAFEDVPAATLLCAALRDELELIRQRVLAAFSMRHGTEGFNRVVFQLAQRDSHSHALALEWLDVTLTGTDRAAVALLEPRLSDRERLNALARTFPLAPLTQRAALLELVEDRDGRWRRPWVKACALYTASGISEAELDAVTAATAATVESSTDPEPTKTASCTRRSPASGTAASISSESVGAVASRCWEGVRRTLAGPVGPGDAEACSGAVATHGSPLLPWSRSDVRRRVGALIGLAR